jgi:hypothetical protein
VSFFFFLFSDPVRYSEILKGCKLLTLNCVYNTQDLSKMDEILSHSFPLPDPPKRDLSEEEPKLINAVRNTIKEK